MSPISTSSSSSVSISVCASTVTSNAVAATTDPREWQLPDNVPIPPKFDFTGSRNRGSLRDDWKDWRERMIAFVKRSGVLHLSAEGRDDFESVMRFATIETIKRGLLLSCLTVDTASMLGRLCGGQRLEKVPTSEIVAALIVHVRHFVSLLEVRYDDDDDDDHDALVVICPAEDCQ